MWEVRNSKGSATAVTNEVEIGLLQHQDGQGWEMVAECVVDMEGAAKVSLEKPILSKLLKAHTLNEWGDKLKIVKKCVQEP